MAALDPKLEAERQKALEYINSAPTPEERNRRKREMYVTIYSNPQKFSDWLKEKGK
jgi:hypothetical protein